MIYRIKVAGMLDQSWSDWLGDVQIMPELDGECSPTTTLVVDASDQSALFGILDHLRDLNLPLMMVMIVEEQQKSSPSEASPLGLPKSQES